MFQQKQKTFRKQRTFMPYLELMAARISPAVLDTSDYGSRNPTAGGPYNASNPYNMSQVYTNLPAAATPMLLANKFPGTYQPTAYFTTQTGSQYEVDLLAATDAPVSQAFKTALDTWEANANMGQPQANQWRITYQPPGDDPTDYVVNSYDAYGSAFQRWYVGPPPEQQVPAKRSFRRSVWNDRTCGLICLPPPRTNGFKS